MIWLDSAKRYLAAFAAKDKDSMLEMYDPEVELFDEYSVHHIGTAKVLEKEIEAGRGNEEGISVKILNTAYKNKIVFIELLIFYITNTITARKDFVYLFDINDNSGKIKSIKKFQRGKIWQ